MKLAQIKGNCLAQRIRRSYDDCKYDLEFMLHDGETIYAFLCFERKPHALWPQSQYMVSLLWHSWEQTLTLTVIKVRHTPFVMSVDLPYLSLCDAVYGAFRHKYGESLLGVVYSGVLSQQRIMDLNLCRRIYDHHWFLSRVIDIDIAVLYNRIQMACAELSAEQVLEEVR